MCDVIVDARRNLVSSARTRGHVWRVLYGDGCVFVVRVTDVMVCFVYAFFFAARHRSTTLKVPKRSAEASSKEKSLMTERALRLDATCLDARACATLPKSVAIASASAAVGAAMGGQTALLAAPNVAGEGDAGADAMDASDDGRNALAVAPAVLTATELVSASVDDNAMIMDVARAIEDVRERVELAIGHCDVGDGGRDEDVADALTIVELRELTSKCEMLRDRGLLHRIGKDELIKVLEILESAARASDDVMIEAHESARDANAQRVMKAVEAIGAYFVILSAADMPKEIFGEEAIDRMIDRTKQHLVRNVFVFHDAGLWNVHRSAEGDVEKENDIGGEGGASTPLKTTKKGASSAKKSAAKASAAKDTSSGAASGGGGAARKVADAVGVKIGVIFTHLSSLISRLTLPDATVLQLTSLSFLSFGIENLSFVQLKSVELVVSIFSQYVEHRAFVIDNILASLNKIPPESRDLRSYNVPGEESTQIQVLIALLMKCLQSSVDFVDASVSSARADVNDAEAAATDVEARSFGAAFMWTNYFWKDLLTRWPKVKAADSELNLRMVINNALVDALACRNLPEWPVANKLILNLAAQLLGEVGLQSKDAKIREIALDFLGQIAARLHADAKACEEDEAWRDLPRASDFDFTEAEEHAGDGKNATTSDAGVHGVIKRALLFAQEDSSKIKTKVDAATASTTALMTFDEAAEEVFVMESILVRYLAENNRGDAASAAVTHRRAGDDVLPSSTTARSKDAPTTSRVTLHTSAMAYHVAQFARDAERAGVGFRQDVTPGGTRAMYGALHAAMSRVAAVARNAAPDSSRARLSRDFAKSLTLRLNARRPLARQLNRLVQRIVGMLDDSGVLVRTSATRAIGVILDEDPSVLRDSAEIEQALRIRLKDTGTSVRSVVVDVLGRQMIRDVALADKYYDMIEDRVSDVGVSVRKKVVTVLHECLRNANFAHARQTMKVLAFRILDEDEGIRSHIVRIFRELWFSPLSRVGGRRRRRLDGDEDNHVAADDNHVDDDDNDDDDDDAHDVDDHDSYAVIAGAEDDDSVASRARRIVDVSWDVYRSVSRSGKQKLPLLPTFPIVSILTHVLYPSEDERLETWVNVAGMSRVARRVVNYMLHALIESESNESNTNGTGGGARQLPDVTNAVPWSVKYAVGLHVFTVVDPVLCLPSRDPTRFAVALQPYLKRVDDDETDAPFVSEKLQCIMSVIHVVTEHAGRLPQSVAREIERDLRVLLLRHHDKSVIYYACKALCAVTATQGGRSSGTISMLKRFVSIVLDSLAVTGANGGDAKLDARQHAYCARSLYVLGNIARFGADVVDAACARDECEISISDLLRVFRKTLENQPEDEYELTRGALGACGDLFVARPELMFNAQGGFGKGSFDLIMRAALSTTAERGLKEQSLHNLSELIREEELRMSANAGGASVDDAKSVAKSAQKRARDAEKLQIVNGERDRSIAGGIAQRYWNDVLALCVDDAAGVRLKALHLVELVLRQGLTHPASAFPTLVAAQLDPSPGVKRLARKLLKTQYTRHGAAFFEHQLARGVELAYAFKRRLEHAARRRKRQQRAENNGGGGAAAAAGDDDDNDGGEADVSKYATPNAAEGFGFIYSLVNGTRTSRNAFLNTLLRRFETASSSSSASTTSTASDVMFLRFLAGVVVELPFTTVDEALYVVFQLNRVISLRGGLLLENLAKALKRRDDDNDGDDASNVAPSAALKADIELACALSVVLLLKSHVKRAYDLSDARVASYAPTEATRNAEIMRFDESVTFDCSVVDASAGQSMRAANKAFVTFKELMTKDASDFAEDMFKETANGKRRGGRAKRVVQDDDNDDDDNDDDDDDDDDNDAYTPLESAGVTKKKAQKKRKTPTTRGDADEDFVPAATPKKKLRF